MTYFSGFSKLGDSTITNDVRNNIISFLDYGLLEKENFINVTAPQSGIYGGEEHKLRLVKDPRYTNGQVWQAFKGNWVWESGFGANVGTNPAKPGVSGVYVNSVFYPNTTTGTYAHTIDHINGKIIFDSAISTNSIVTCNYSYKYVNVLQIDGLNWFKQVHKRSGRSDLTDFIEQSGDWSRFSENQLQLPAIGVELSALRTLSPYQLGGGKKVKTGLTIHCVAEDVYLRDHLVDIISYQEDRTILTYDLNQISDNNAFPINHFGAPVSGALRYPELVSNYPFGYLTISNIRLNSVYEIGSIYISTIKCDTEIALGV